MKERLAQLYESIGTRDLIEIAILAVVIYVGLRFLRRTRGAGIVRGSRRGREIAYSLVDEHIAHIVADAVSHAREAS